MNRLNLIIVLSLQNSANLNTPLASFGAFLNFSSLPIVFPDDFIFPSLLFKYCMIFLVPGIMGVLQAAQAIKVITGFGGKCAIL